jgi:2'-5' RNA ligase
MTGYHDYLIMLSPPDSIISGVKKLKDFSFSRIGEYQSRYSKAHITVQPWPRKKPVWIEPLIPKLVRDLQTLPPVILDINGFGFFDQQETATIYAKLTSTPLTKIWFKTLRRFFSNENSEPHITIARNLPKETFKELWPYFKNLQWNEQFKVDKLTILRREMIGHDKIYKVFKEIPFNKNLDFYAYTTARIKTPASLLNKVNMQQISLF